MDFGLGPKKDTSRKRKRTVVIPDSADSTDSARRSAGLSATDSARQSAGLSASIEENNFEGNMPDATILGNGRTSLSNLFTDCGELSIHEPMNKACDDSKVKLEKQQLDSLLIHATEASAQAAARASFRSLFRAAKPPKRRKRLPRGSRMVPMKGEIDIRVKLQPLKRGLEEEDMVVERNPRLRLS